MSYVSFLWKSSNDHGIHSPFVFSFISTTFYNGSPLRELRSAKISGPLHPRTLRVLYKIIVNRKAFKILVFGAQAREITEQLRAAAEMTKSQLFFSPLATVPGGVDLGIITGTSAAEILEQWSALKLKPTQTALLCYPKLTVIPRRHVLASLATTTRGYRNHRYPLCRYNRYAQRTGKAALYHPPRKSMAAMWHWAHVNCGTFRIVSRCKS
jgi:hypothetical protein